MERQDDPPPADGMQVEVKFDDGWYPGVVTHVKVTDGVFSLTVWFECDQTTEQDVPYPHHECRRLLTQTRKRKRKRVTAINPKRAAILSTCKGSLIVKLVRPFLY